MEFFALRRWFPGESGELPSVKEYLVGSESDCYKWLHRNCSCSWFHAIKYEGYEIVNLVGC